MKGQYILDENGTPTEAPDLMTWGQWMQTADRTVAKTEINGVKISTVFLGLDHAWDGQPPLLWETMVFGGPLNEEQERCGGSREQAEAMHAAMCARVSSENAIVVAPATLEPESTSDVVAG